MKFDSSPLKSSIRALPALIYVKAWKACASDSMQKHVFFQGVTQGPTGKSLKLRVPDSTWRNEMNLQRARILASFCETCRSMGLEKGFLPIECVIVL